MSALIPPARAAHRPAARIFDATRVHPMKFICQKSRLRGDVTIPGSKSHTIRAVAIASLAPGESRILAPLESADTLAAVEAYRHLGAEIDGQPDLWRVTGTGGDLRAPENVIDVKNSGTTLRTVLGSCALLRESAAVVTGDAQVCSRPAGPLANSLNELGASVRSTRNNGRAPFVIEGKLRGGETTIEAQTSQYVTSLLLNTPLADGDTTIHVPVLNEHPYVQITIDWLDRQGIQFEHDEMREFRIPGGQTYRTVDRAIPADFSSATFFLAAGALADNEVTLRGLDMTDSQGDKAVIDYLRQMGADIDVRSDSITVRGGQLQGTELDLNATPDALPMMAVVGCFASGTTTLANVAQARIKETDRIAVMCQELSRMGARVRELPDGLVIEQSELTGTEVHGHDDHRVVMALAVAGLNSPGETVIRSAEAVEVTFPTFLNCMTELGADLRPYLENNRC
jgi:3-phosphoshikimate 1-carboxyvinyltransferase